LSKRSNRKAAPRCRSRPPASLGEARFDDLIHGIVDEVQADDLGGDG